MIRRLGLLAGAVVAFFPAQGFAKTDTIEQAGQAIAIALPVVAGGVSLFKNDWTGLGEEALVTGATVGTAFGLKHLVHEERPDHSNDQSFPSDTAALAFAPANYLWDRYGWQWGAPAYAAAIFVGYSRVESKQHHWWDVATSAGMAWGCSRIFTSRWVNPNIYGAAYVDSRGAYLTVNYRF